MDGVEPIAMNLSREWGADAISFLAHLLQTIAMTISDRPAPILRNNLHISPRTKSARIDLKMI